MKIMDGQMALVAVGVLMLAIPGICRPSGAPTRACVDMTPGHGSQSPDPAPFRIHLRTYNGKPAYGYSLGQRLNVTVKLTGDTQFRGILMQMREVGSDVPVGTWMNVAENTRTLSCTNAGDSVTHKNPEKKRDSSFTWIAPTDKAYMYKRLEITATIAEEMSTWWKNVKTAPITYTSGASPCPLEKVEDNLLN